MLSTTSRYQGLNRMYLVHGLPRPAKKGKLPYWRVTCKYHLCKECFDPFHARDNNNVDEDDDEDDDDRDPLD